VHSQVALGNAPIPSKLGFARLKQVSLLGARRSVAVDRRASLDPSSFVNFICFC
jgi:hypothetical protein